MTAFEEKLFLFAERNLTDNLFLTVMRVQRAFQESVLTCCIH